MICSSCGRAKAIRNLGVCAPCRDQLALSRKYQREHPDAKPEPVR